MKDKGGEALHVYVLTLVTRGAPGSEAICLLGVCENAKVVLVHSLFTVPTSPYSTKTKLWGVVDMLPTSRPSAVIQVTPLHFAPNTPFEEYPKESLRATLPAYILWRPLTPTP